MDDPYDYVNGSHVLIVMREWTEFTTYDYTKIYETMMKPAFVFEGRNILCLEDIGSSLFWIYSKEAGTSQQ